jgi:hypothetical protein
MFLFRSTEVQWEQLKLDKTCTIYVRPDHWLLDELGQSVGVGLPPFLDIFEPRLGDVRLMKTGEVNGSEVCIGNITEVAQIQNTYR